MTDDTLPDIRPSAETGTRRRILEILKWRGPTEAGAMAEILGLSAMAVRQHLYALADQRLVAARTEPRGVGRPAKLWSLTGSADAFFPNGYADLTADLLASIREAFGQEGISRIVEVRTRAQIAAYRARMDGAASLEERIRRLVAIRTTEGYMAEATLASDGGMLFVENHCPICAAARACTGLCAAELHLFEAVLGPEVAVRRVEHILAGARRCVYRISPR